MKSGCLEDPSEGVGCLSCDEEDYSDLFCEDANRACNHHCNHFVTHGVCCWCEEVDEEE